MNDPFKGEDHQRRILKGVTIISGSARLVELAGQIGFDTVWIELEHGPASFSEVEILCMAAEARGAIPTVRVPDHQRHHILRALEVGARIVIVPMVNDADTARDIVKHGKFPPLGGARL
jgi:4-hydroxy-2-oxoheptanedioate aldolase